jgi:signal transduction histidine kinase
MVGLNLIQVLLISVGVTNFALGLLVLFGFNKKKDSSSIWFALVAFSVVLWTASMIIYRGMDDVYNIVLYSKILYSSALLIPIAFLIFVHRFVSKQYIYKSEFLVFLSFVGLVILTFFTPHIINSVTINKPLENQIIFGNLFFLYVIFLIIVFNISFYNLIVKYKQNKGVKKTQILFIILGTTLSTYPAFFSNLILPWIGIFNFNWFGQISTIFLIIFTTYAIFKHHLFNIKMILSEIILGIISIVLFIYIFLSRNTYDLIVSIIFFIIFVGLGYNLLRELLRGIKREKELSISNRKLEETIESKDMFLRMTSHQLRTPLTSLNGFLSLILEQREGKYKMNEYTRDDIIKVYINTQRLVELVNDVLSLNSIKAGRFGIALRPQIDIKEELTYLIQDNKYILDYFNTKVIMKTIGENFIANVDNVRMKSVFQNLLSNAMYYGKDKIWVTLIDEGDRLRIRFRDNGKGVSLEVIDKLFKPGFRAGGIEDRNPNGSGFGLFISKTIVEMHNGTLKLKDNIKANGSVFELKLPKNPPIDKYTT